MSLFHTDGKGVSDSQTSTNSEAFEKRPLDILTPRRDPVVALNEQMKAMEQDQNIDVVNASEVFSLLQKRSDLTKEY